jgi:hypothetical protein
MIATASTPATNRALGTLTKRYNSQESREERASDKARDERMVNLVNKVNGILSDKTQWASGEAVTVAQFSYRKRAATMWVKNCSGFLTLQLCVESASGRLDQRFYSEALQLGFLDLKSGQWKAKLSLEGYKTWAFETKKRLIG